jgi:diguanylate cyclase (GGDEF)-like protein
MNSTAFVRISNWLLSGFAGIAAFLFTLLGFLLLGRVDQQIVASLFIGLFALAIVRLAAERPNSAQARAVTALVDRLLAVSRGDLRSPAPQAVRTEMPALAAAVDGLFEQVRSNLDNFHAMAMYDPVTSLPNRIHFRREADRILGSRSPDDQTALLFIDLDGFKEVNDRLGHAHGDQVLAMVANRLRVVVKAECEPGSLAQPLLARLAGDEFTLLLPNSGGAADAERIACRALAALAETFRIGSQSIDIGASIGVALCPDHGTELTPLMKAADVAMYHAKASGRSRVCLYDAELARVSRERAALAEDLREAIGQDRLDLVYRPRLCLRTGAIVSGEALVRWTRASGERRHFEELTGLAEETGLNHRIADWTFSAAASAAARIRAAELPQRVCLKILPAELHRGDFEERLRAAVAEAGAPLDVLELELGAGELVRCSARARAALASLRRDGVSVAASGFGSEGTSFAALADFPLDTVKLESSLVRSVARSSHAQTVVAALVHLIHGIGCAAVGEGVEREEELELLRSTGCNYVEGLFAAEPLAEDEFIGWVASQGCARSLAQAS